MPHRPAPLRDAAATRLAQVHTVLTDIDDTLTSEGHLTAAAYAALEALHERGLRVIPVTGRPAGWCDMIARFWPVDGVVGENGAFTFRYNHATKVMERRYALSAEDRAAGRAKLDALETQILKAVPGSAVAADQAYRAADLAIDFCEDVAPLPPADVERIVALFKAAGAQAKASSIHVNGWFGAYDKLSAVRELLKSAFGLTFEDEKSGIAFVGDSPNDAPLFAALPLSFGVANVIDFSGRIAAMPAFVTPSRGGAGFAEFASALLAAKTQG